MKYSYKLIGFKLNREDNTVNQASLFLDFALMTLPQGTVNDILSTNDLFEARLQREIRNLVTSSIDI